MSEKIIFVDRDTVRANIRRPNFEHSWTDHPKTAPDQVVERCRDATIIVCNKVVLRGETLAQLPKVRMIAAAATGTDNYDLEYCKTHGIVVSNIRGYAVHAVPEHAMTLILALRRNLLAYRADVRAGRWQQAPMFCFFDHPIHDLHGSTLALVGSGSLGQGLAKLAEGFGMRVIYAERRGAETVRPGYVDFDTALREADVLSLHCPLTPQTRNLIGEAELRAMKESAILINTGRGGLVDEEALARALREGWIAGAGSDVLSKEPPVDGNVLLAPELLDLPNFILTPHIAWASDEAMQILADQLVDNIEAFVRGEPRNRVV